jgi:hypothetical protein
MLLKGIRDRLHKLDSTIRKQTRAMNEENERKNRESRPEPKEPLIAKIELTRPVEIQKTDRDTTDERTFQNRTVLVSIVGTVISVVTLIGFYRQIRITKDQVAITKAQLAITQGQLEQMHLDERPWIQVSVDGTRLKELDVPARTFHLLNSGKTPAESIRGIFGIETVKNGQYPKLDFSETKTTYSTGVIFPGSKDFDVRINRIKLFPPTPPAVDDPVGHEEFKRFTNHEEFLVCYARIFYKDNSGTGHWTQYCAFEGTEGGSYNANNCTEFNANDTRGQ